MVHENKLKLVSSGTKLRETITDKKLVFKNYFERKYSKNLICLGNLFILKFNFSMFNDISCCTLY